MKCANCGAELRLGSLFCVACGQEAQIVSHSGLLEEELLRDLLKEEELKEESESENDSDSFSTEIPKKKKSNQKKKKTLFFLFFFSFLITAILGTGITFFLLKKHNDNSYEYQVQKAELSLEEKDYTKALEYYKQALRLSENASEQQTIKHSMLEIYFTMEDETTAVDLLKELISENPKDEKAYRFLIGYYHEKEAFSEILKLKEEKESVASAEIKELFSLYETKMPKFSIEPGIYAEYLTIELLGEETEIYYTLDGTDPVAHGKLYQRPIEINHQRTLKVRAVACNEYGIYSQEIHGNFTVRFQKPAMPKATPDRGTFYEPTKVELLGNPGDRIYYTWDGSTPTMDSELYTEPLEIPEGDWILSAILVDQYGMMSNVLKCNYKYLPQEILEY